jgi:putative methyltransferase (TIGR04325 family)
MTHTAFGALHRLIDRAALLPGVRQLRRALFARRFRGAMGHTFHGVYDSFAAAAAAGSGALPPSYDNDDAARMYVQRTAVDDHDWPALFWLQDAFASGRRRVVDVGGSTGIKFHALAQLVALPHDVQWCVVETPAAVRLGRELAAKASATQLTFTSELRDTDGADVWLASGSLQYLPHSLGELLAMVRTRPARLVVNTTPIHPSRSFFTRNNLGTACCPYRVSSREDFVAMASAHGYRVRAEWRNLTKGMPLPYEPGLSLAHYSGFCFDRDASPAG